MSEFRTVAVIGLGYIGLPTAAILASKGTRVIGVDVNPVHVAAVNRGEVPFVEPDLATHVAGAASKGLLTAQAETPAADCYVVAVPTPFKDGHKPDLSYIRAAAENIAPQLRGGELVILESTCPPGATQQLADIITTARPDLAAEGDDEHVVDFAHCPERVLPGRVMIELVTNDRIIGGLTPRGAERAKRLYQIFCKGELLLTDAPTAEMAKLVENSFRDVNIAFANELSLICDRLGIDVWDLIELANHHPRVNILQPGPGVGGHCIAVDPWFIVDTDPENARLIRTAREVNDSKPGYVLDRIRRAVDGTASPTVAVLGLAFKADIDDLRESPALRITEDLAARMPKARILAVEPNIEKLPASLDESANVELADLDDAIETADVVALLVDHKEFKEVPKERFAGKVLIDTKGTSRRL